MQTAPDPSGLAESPDWTDDDVVLLDDDRNPVGRLPRSLVHHADTPLHLAFSCYLFDAAGRVLLTRRALGKLTWPGVWTNSCCGHPRPGEPIEEAVNRRCEQELGVTVEGLRCVLPDFSYRVEDPSGIRENEFCPVFVARVHPDSPVRPYSDEVMEHAWSDWGAAVSSVQATPFVFSPWSVLQVEQLTTVLGSG